MVFFNSRISPFTSTVIFLDKVTIRHRSCYLGNITYLAGKVTGHLVYIESVKIFPGSTYTFYICLSTEFTFCTYFACHTGYFRSKMSSAESTIVLMVFFNSRISPLTSTVIFLDRSPFATAVVTSAMLRTWLSGYAAIVFTLSVSSFQTPPHFSTFACPPSLPSVPTSRATRVTSSANMFS